MLLLKWRHRQPSTLPPPNRNSVIIQIPCIGFDKTKMTLICFLDPGRQGWCLTKPSETRGALCVCPWLWLAICSKKTSCLRMSIKNLNFRVPVNLKTPVYLHPNQYDIRVWEWRKIPTASFFVAPCILECFPSQTAGSYRARYTCVWGSPPRGDAACCTEFLSGYTTFWGKMEDSHLGGNSLYSNNSTK